MAAFDIYFKGKVAGLPSGHVNTTSKFGLSFIDVSQVWPGLSRTVLSVIASEFTPLENLPRTLVVASLLDDLRPYLPFLADSEVEKVEFQGHEDKPLFMNDVGGWSFRPTSFTEVPNLYLAGDYCRTHVDLVSMEGAITSGLLAARAIQKDCKVPEDIEILVPKIYPDFLLKIAKLCLLPAAALARLILLLFFRPEPKLPEFAVVSRWEKRGPHAQPERQREARSRVSM